MIYLQHLGPLEIPLIALSLIGSAVIFERIIFYIRLPKIDNCATLKEITDILRANSTQPKLVRDEIASHLLLKAKVPYDFGIRIMRLISIISPMLGLLGTVIGIISSFKTIAAHQGPVYPALIADGLWVAMITTAVGLAIALPCLISAFIFSRAGEKRIAAYQDYLNKISLEIEGAKL